MTRTLKAMTQKLPYNIKIAGQFVKFLKLADL